MVITRRASVTITGNDDGKLPGSAPGHSAGLSLPLENKEYGRCKQRRLHFSFLVPAAKLPSGLPTAPSIGVKASELIVFSWFSDVLEKFS